MAIVGSIAHTKRVTIGKAHQTRSLDLQEEYINGIIDPQQFKPLSRQHTSVDLSPIEIGNTDTQVIRLPIQWPLIRPATNQRAIQRCFIVAREFARSWHKIRLEILFKKLASSPVRLSRAGCCLTKLLPLAHRAAIAHVAHGSRRRLCIDCVAGSQKRKQRFTVRILAPTWEVSKRNRAPMAGRRPVAIVAPKMHSTATCTRR